MQNLFYDRFWASKQGKAPTPTQPGQSLVMDGGTATVEQMIKSTRRGLLVSFFWYIRPVEQMTLLNTGHDARRPVPHRERRGRRAGAELPLEHEPGASGSTTSRCSARPVPMHTGEAYDNPGTALIPAMRIEDFRMTSISPAV